MLTLFYGLLKIYICYLSSPCPLPIILPICGNQPALNITCDDVTNSKLDDILPVKGSSCHILCHATSCRDTSIIHLLQHVFDRTLWTLHIMFYKEYHIFYPLAMTQIKLTSILLHLNNITTTHHSYTYPACLTTSVCFCPSQLKSLLNTVFFMFFINFPITSYLFNPTS